MASKEQLDEILDILDGIELDVADHEYLLSEMFCWKSPLATDIDRQILKCGIYTWVRKHLEEIQDLDQRLGDAKDELSEAERALADLEDKLEEADSALRSARYELDNQRHKLEA